MIIVFVSFIVCQYWALRWILLGQTHALFHTVLLWSRVLLDRKVPLRMRSDRIRETIYRTVLFGTGGLYMSEAVIGSLGTFENKILKRTLNQAQREGETPADFHSRLNGKLKKLKEVLGWMPVSILAKRLNISWLGHVALWSTIPRSRIS